MRVLIRGLTRRCGRCGSGHLFQAWFKMVDCCPRCKYLFNREEGFFLGAVLINFVVTEILLGAVLGAMIATLAGGGGQSLTPIIIAAIGETVLVPVLFYPFSKTTWAAIDLILHRGEAWSAEPDRPTAAGAPADGTQAMVSRPDTSTEPSAASQT